MGALRTRIHEVAAGRAAAGARLEADVVHAAQDLAHAAGEGDPRGIDKDASERLTAGLARAAGIDMVADAAARSYRLRAGRHTGWIATRWLSRFRKDPSNGCTSRATTGTRTPGCTAPPCRP